MRFRDHSGISLTICKQSAPRPRQITTPTPRHLIFTGRMLFLVPKQRCSKHWRTIIRSTVMALLPGTCQFGRGLCWAGRWRRDSWAAHTCDNPTAAALHWPPTTPSLSGCPARTVQHDRIRPATGLPVAPRESAWVFVAVSNSIVPPPAESLWLIAIMVSPFFESPIFLAIVWTHDVIHGTGST